MVSVRNSHFWAPVLGSRAFSFPLITIYTVPSSPITGELKMFVAAKPHRFFGFAGPVMELVPVRRKLLRNVGQGEPELPLSGVGEGGHLVQMCLEPQLVKLIPPG